MARRPVKQARQASTRTTTAQAFGGATLPRPKASKTNKKVQGRATLGGGSGLYG